jgi:hypothetical protein
MKGKGSRRACPLLSCRQLRAFGFRLVAQSAEAVTITSFRASHPGNC